MNHKNNDTIDRNIRRVFWAELCLLRASDILPETYEGGRLTNVYSSIYDLNGEILFYRVGIESTDGQAGFADISLNPAFADPVLATAEDARWEPEKLISEAFQHAQKYIDKPVASVEIRFVAYSHPKLAIEFLVEGESLVMLELFSWHPIDRREQKDQDGKKELGLMAFSYADAVADDVKEKNQAILKERQQLWEKSLALESIRKIDPSRIKGNWIQDLEWIIWKPLSLYTSRELHYSSRNDDHFTCYEVRGQETNVWCVGASVQMMLDFYRYEYTQVRLARELGLGTLQNPNGLPYANVGDIPTVLERMTNNALDATLVTSPGFNLFKSEILANRPVNSIIDGHSRTVAGYKQSLLFYLPTGLPTYRGLLVYDPWPPNAGVIRRWENFTSNNHLWATTAQLNLA